MSKVFVLSAVLVTALAVPALAGSPPTPSKTGPDMLAAACGALGEDGERISRGNLTGCVNTTTGAALTCEAGGRCMEYFADPRYAKVKAILDGNGKQEMPTRL